MSALLARNLRTSVLRQLARAPVSRLPQRQCFPNRSFSALSGSPVRPTMRAVREKDDIASTNFEPSLQPLSQVRGGKRNTYSPSHRIRKRRHGFLARLKTRTGRMILTRRRVKGRTNLSH